VVFAVGTGVAGLAGAALALIAPVTPTVGQSYVVYAFMVVIVGGLGSLLGTAIDYALGQWRTLEIYLTDGRVEIDNNLVENAIRPTAIGKKNWLFVGEAHAGQHDVAASGGDRRRRSGARG